ncbi:MAG: M55 family metallopeptidase [Clostridia bacterium]|nr:M55 family metallopeptidase [Clostridia bacterium]
MNVVIMTDLEGISGVDSIANITDKGEPYRYACERLMADTNAAVEGAIKAGAEKVYVIDGHGGGQNFIDELLDKRATKISVDEWVKLTREKAYEAYLQVGAHAKPGTINGFLDHVQSSLTWFSYKANGKLYGELVQGGLFVGAFGIPTVMVSGDEAVCNEAVQCFGDSIALAEVKKGVGRNSADCLDIELAEKLICDAAEDGVRRRAEMKPFELDLPITFEVTHTRTDYCEATLKRCPDATRIDARTAQRVVEKIEVYGDVTFR